MAAAASSSNNNLYALHRGIMSQYMLLGGDGGGGGTSDIDILHKHYRFIMDDDEGEAPPGWEYRMAKRYYDKLFREYALADLTRYKEGKVGLRWRTEREVVEGKGQFTCGNKHCDERRDLASYELNFRYQEDGMVKNELVKVRVCPRCVEKLFFKKTEAERKAAALNSSGSTSSSTMPRRPSSSPGGDKSKEMEEDEEEDRSRRRSKDERKEKKKRKKNRDDERVSSPGRDDDRKKRPKPHDDDQSREGGEGKGEKGDREAVVMTDEAIDAYIRQLLM